MTFSLLAFDGGSGTWGGVAATGNLCVGGWVLRGRADAGISAAQGHTPSTLWGEEVLARQSKGQTAADAVAAVVSADPGSGFRQLASIDLNGGCGVHSGAKNLSFCGHLQGDGFVAAGNILTGRGVLTAMADAFQTAAGSLPARLLAALAAGEAAGGDDRGTMSAALMHVGPAMAPLDLRVDLSPNPVDDLRALHARTEAEDYRSWVRTVPVATDPFRAPGGGGESGTPVAISDRP